jgi:hypothetical protein
MASDFSVRSLFSRDLRRRLGSCGGTAPFTVRPVSGLTSGLVSCVLSYRIANMPLFPKHPQPFHTQSAGAHEPRGVWGVPAGLSGARFPSPATTTSAACKSLQPWWPQFRPACSTGCRSESDSLLERSRYLPEWSRSCIRRFRRRPGSQWRLER